MSTPDHAAIGHLARRQGGHVARWQLEELGFSPGQIDVRMRRDGWGVPHVGVYLAPGVEPSEEGANWAAVLAVGPRLARAEIASLEGPRTVTRLTRIAADGAYVTGLTAARALGHDCVAPRCPQLLLPSPRRVRRSQVRIVRTIGLGPPPSRHRNGYLTAPPPRVAWDVAWIERRVPTGMRTMLDLLVAFDRLRLVSITTMQDVVTAPQEHGLPTQVPKLLRAAVAVLAGGFSHSASEAEVRDVIREVAADKGFTASDRPHPIMHGGVQIAETDVAIPELWFAAEVDGPPHDLAAQRRKDFERDSKVARTPWTVRRYPTAEYEQDPSAFRLRVARDIDQAAAAMRAAG